MIKLTTLFELLSNLIEFTSDVYIHDDRVWRHGMTWQCVVSCHVEHVFLDKYTHVRILFQKKKFPFDFKTERLEVYSRLVKMVNPEGNGKYLSILHRESVLWFGYKSNARSYVARWKCLSYSMRDPNGLFAVVFISIAYNPLLLLIFQLDPVSCWILKEWILSNLKNCQVMMRRYLRSESIITCKTL